MPLTNAQVKALKPKDKPFKVSDEKGLIIEVTTSGSKRWRLRYRFGGKEKLALLKIKWVNADSELRKPAYPSVEKRSF